MRAYYNEIDPYAAEWLRNLIAAGHIAPGEVDERSIVDVTPGDLRGYAQCHFFAGIGGWSYALRLAGWDDSRPVWTGSCPCQPFSVAGRGKGAADERHLWPAFASLIEECRPAAVFGEQVASRAGREWLAGVRDDMEAMGYAVGAADLCAASAGAPHIRQRLWWVADADPAGQRLERGGGLLDGQRATFGNDADGCGEVRGLAHSETDGRQQVGADGPGGAERSLEEGRAAGLGLRGASDWSEYVWVDCADGKARRIEPSIEPLAHGFSESMANVLSLHHQTWQEVINCAETSKSDPDEILRMVREIIYAQTNRKEQPARVRFELHAPSLLLDLLLGAEAARDRTPDSRCRKEEGTKIVAGAMRCLRLDGGPVCPPHRRQAEEQQAEQFTDPVHALSLVLARHTEAYRNAVQSAHAALNRVAMLRAYGNAIVPAVAATFVRAYLT